MSDKATRTRKLIICKTAPLFNRQGFNGTSLLDLTQATGLSKGALYGNFKNKQGIALEVFKYSTEKTKEVATGQLRSETTNKGKLKNLFQFYANYVINSPIPGGCPMMNAAVEADDHQTFLKRVVAQEMEATIHYIAKLLERGKKEGEFKAAVKPMELAQTFFCAIEGAIVISRVMSSKAPMKSVLNHCHYILNQISL
ncbi:MAG: TetR/AcrR family transcriptional regulator [Chryseolinea sp.]